MASRLSDSADTSEKEGGDDVAKEVGRSQSSRPNKSIPSDHGQKFLAKDVFLNHSGKNSFARQLYTDLTNQGLSCFFDEDCESLPVREDFPSRILDAAKTCKTAVLLLSKDYLETKWAMQELCAIVEARDITNPNLKILPVFFLISPDALKNSEYNDKKWEQLGISVEERAKWHRALKAIRPINGLRSGERGDELKLREEIAKEIWWILRKPSPRYPVYGMQGQVRMCQEVAEFFNTIYPNEKGIRIAGLYGIAGSGKTTLGKAFCGFTLGDFEGRVCYLDLSRGDSFKRLKLALHYLTFCPPSLLQQLTSQDQGGNLARVEFYERVKDQRVLLVLDTITEESIDEVRFYVLAGFRENSCILLSTRSIDILEKHFKIKSQSCMPVPRLESDEAIRILLDSSSIRESTLGEKDKEITLKCANRCLFKEVSGSGLIFNPSALKDFGSHLFSKYGSNLSEWDAEIERLVDPTGYGLDALFAVLDQDFENMSPKYRTIFMLLTVYILPNISTNKVTKWLAINCNEEISFVEKAVQDLCKKAFIEEVEPAIFIHNLYIEFAQSKAKEMGRWLCWKGDACSTRALISSEAEGFELARLEQSMYPRIAPRYLQNLRVLQLVGVQNMSNLDLGQMVCLRSITIHKCEDLAALEGMTKLRQLAWLQISEVNPMFKLPELRSLKGLQYLEIHIAESLVPNQLGDLTDCVFLREISVCCPSLSEFPKLKGLPHLEKVEFSQCDKVQGALDCRECVELQRIILKSCCPMTSPLLAGCKKLSKKRFVGM